ncbi:helix-hairpin-helix domain-containing protein [Streptomyces sp. S1]|uniref:helix-hairpin-helix domain-containing protein n=1 Tax=Streptomyces sp. S1 TaxID=718288 RepID=UPI003D70F0F8
MTLRTRIASTTAVAGTTDTAVPGAVRTTGAVRATGGPTSGPGRAAGSDGRGRPGGRGSPPGRGRPRIRVGGRSVDVPGGVVRRRGDALFPTAFPPEPSAEVAAPGGGEAEGAPERVASPVPPPGVRERLVAGIRDRTPLWVQTRCGLEPRTLTALAMVLVVAVGLAAGYFWTGRPEPVRAPELVRAAPATAVPAGRGGPEQEARQETGPPPAPPVPLAPPVSPAPSGAEVVVDVGGKVRRPGVLTLPAGSRVADALRAAGGVRSGADLTGINRARVLADGEQVLVDVPGAPAGGSGPGPGSGGGAGGAAGGGAPGTPVSLNTATVEQLDTLPGVGPVLAQHIIDHRTEHGGFRSVGELREVSGIGERRFADLEPLVRP